VETNGKARSRVRTLGHDFGSKQSTGMRMVGKVGGGQPVGVKDGALHSGWKITIVGMSVGGGGRQLETLKEAPGDGSWNCRGQQTSEGGTKRQIREGKTSPYWGKNTDLVVDCPLFKVGR